MSELGALPMALFLAVFIKAALDRVASLIRAKWPEADLALPLGIVAILLGGALGWLAQINVLEGLPLDPMLGRALTAIAVGLGVEFLNDVLASVQGRNGAVVTVLQNAAQPAARVIGMTTDEPEAPTVLLLPRNDPRVRGW